MTRSQVRAAMRRMRDHNEEIEEEAGELNLVPYMDIVTNIIIFLLASVVNQVALTNINVSVPTISAGGGAATDEPPPEKPPLNLTVSVGASGFTVADSPTRTGDCSLRASSRSSDSIRCEPRLLPATACSSSTITLFTDFSMARPDSELSRM